MCFLHSFTAGGGAADLPLPLQGVARPRRAQRPRLRPQLPPRRQRKARGHRDGRARIQKGKFDLEPMSTG